MITKVARIDVLMLAPLVGSGWGGGDVSGEGAWSGGRGVMTDNPRLITLSHTPRYTVKQCAADCQRFASTAAHFAFSI